MLTGHRPATTGDEGDKDGGKDGVETGPARSLVRDPGEAGAVGPGTVAIALSTFNGARFLDAQLASLANQTHRDWRLVVRDDGSTDRTRVLLAEWFRRDPRIVALHVGANRGPAASFWDILAHHLPAGVGAFALCDQDDVWFPDKLARAWAALDRAASDRTDPTRGAMPRLYCARQTLVDANLTPLGLSPDLRRPIDLRNALVENRAVGCTCVGNGALLAAVQGRPFCPAMRMHDWWLVLLTLALGGAVIADPEPCLFYRQHGGNAIGGRTGGLAGGIARLRRGLAWSPAAVRAQAAALLADRAAEITPEAHRLLEAFVRPRQGLARLGACFGPQAPQRQDRLDDLVLKALLLAKG